MTFQVNKMYCFLHKVHSMHLKMLIFLIQMHTGHMYATFISLPDSGVKFIQ